MALALAALGCDGDPVPPTPARQQALTESAAEPTSAAPQLPKKQPGKPVQVKVGKNVVFERGPGDRRRVLVNAYVCLREGALEQLLCRRHTKEHEAILAADVDARDIHTALVLAGAKEGSTVRYEEKGDKVIIHPPTGQPIKVTLQYQEKGKVVTVPAQQWVRDMRTKKDLEYDWVFAGSRLFENPDDKNKPRLYAANSGDVITVSNFEGSMLDLPINSSKDNNELQFEANTARIPPLETEVTIILEPLPAVKK
jgi:hypothetical protein